MGGEFHLTGSQHVIISPAPSQQHMRPVSGADLRFSRPQPDTSLYCKTLCTAPWSGTPCRMTSTHGRTMNPLDRAWKPGYSPDTSVLSALETMR